MTSDDLRTSQPPRPRIPGPGIVPTFRCDRCHVTQTTLGRKRLRRVMWVCRHCLAGARA